MLSSFPFHGPICLIDAYLTVELCYVKVHTVLHQTLAHDSLTLQRRAPVQADILSRHLRHLAPSTVNVGKLDLEFRRRSRPDCTAANCCCDLQDRDHNHKIPRLEQNKGATVSMIRACFEDAHLSRSIIDTCALHELYELRSKSSAEHDDLEVGAFMIPQARVYQSLPSFQATLECQIAQPVQHQCRAVLPQCPVPSRSQ